MKTAPLIPVRWIIAATLGLGLLTASVHGQHDHGPVVEKFGKVSFPITGSDLAKKHFERGVATMHSFWYEEAEKEFTAAIEADPNCAMAYWGLAMSYYHPIWEPPDKATLSKGWVAIQKAKSLSGKTQRESDYLNALEVFYKDYETLDHRTRSVAYAKAMEELYPRYPDDHEAAIFCALAFLGIALPTDKTHAMEIKAGEILEKILPKEPEHPGVAHYIIHAYDSPPLASRALEAARRYSKIAPSAPHALHMPSHIFTRLGYWEESAESNEASAASAKAYAERGGKTGMRDRLHAMDYLMYAYLQLGRETEAKRILADQQALAGKGGAERAAVSANASIPARYAVENQNWSEAAKLIPTSPQWGVPGAITYFAGGLGAARSGDLSSARVRVGYLKAIRDSLATLKQQYWSDQVEVQRLAVEAWIAHAEARDDEALNLLRAAADLEDSYEKSPMSPGPIVPARELLGEFLLATNKPVEAKKEFLTALEISPNRARGLFGAARAAELSGDQKSAKELYGQFLRLWSGAEKTRPEVSAAQAFIGK